MPKSIKGQAHVPTQQEFKRLLKVVAASKHPKRDTLLIYMSFGLGLRAVELAALKIKDVLKENYHVKEIINLQRTKNNKPRPVYLPDKSEDARIHDALIDYINYRKVYAEKKRATFSFSQPLFLSQKGTGFTNKGMQKVFERIYREAGLVGCSSHSGRRTFATNLIEQGIDIKAVSTLMGHASVAMTAQYVENNPTRLRKIAAKALY